MRLLLLVSFALFTVAASAAAPPTRTAVFTALDAVGPIDGDRFDPRPVIAAVNLLVPLGKAEGIATLSAYLDAHRAAIDSGERDGLFAVLRVLFEPPPSKPPFGPDACTPRQTAMVDGGCLRAPRLGAPSPPPPEDLRSLRYPFFVLGDVPLSLVHGYVLGGSPEPLAMHLRDLAAVASWRTTPLTPLSAGEIRMLFVHYGQWSGASEVGKMVEAQLKRLETPPEPPAAAVVVRLRVGPAAGVDRAVTTLRARLEQLAATGRFRLTHGRVSASAKGEITVEAELPAGPICSPQAMTLVAESLGVQLTRSGELGFHRVVEGNESGLQGALAGLGGTISVVMEQGHARVTGLDARSLSARLATLTAPAGVQFVVDPPPPGLDRGSAIDVWAIEAAPSLTAGDLDSAPSETKAAVAIATDDGYPQVRLRFTDAGKARFAALSTSLVDRHLAIVFEGRLVSAPLVREPITGGEAVIAFGGEVPERLADDAKEIAAVLSAGPLGATVALIDSHGSCPPATLSR